MGDVFRKVPKSNDFLAANLIFALMGQDRTTYGSSICWLFQVIFVSCRILYTSLTFTPA